MTMNKQIVVIILFITSAIFGQTEKLSLNEAIETALKNNPQILTAEKEIFVIEGKILQAGRIPNAEFSIESNEIPTDLSFSKADELDINFSQQLEFFGKRRMRIQSVEYQKQIAKLNLERIKKIITAQVNIDYYQFLH